MPANNRLITQEHIESQVIEIRGQKVILDSDLARIYGVATKRLNEQVKRNADRFPDDFAFRLEAEEAEILRSRNASVIDAGNRSQFATGSQRHRDPRYLPWAFTEYGAIMAATVLNSSHAVQMSVFVVRAFVKMRRMMIVQRDLSKKLAEIEKKLTERLDVHETAIVEVLRQMMTLLTPSPNDPDPPRRQIGFGVR